MIERYTNPEMGNIWTLQHEFETMLDVEIAACEAMAELGEIPQEAAANIRAMTSSLSSRTSRNTSAKTRNTSTRD